VRLAIWNAFDGRHAASGTFSIDHASNALDRFINPGLPRTLQGDASSVERQPAGQTIEARV
jgi:hypothetical protein